MTNAHKKRATIAAGLTLITVAVAAYWFLHKQAAVPLGEIEARLTAPESSQEIDLLLEELVKVFSRNKLTKEDKKQLLEGLEDKTYLTADDSTLLRQIDAGGLEDDSSTLAFVLQQKIPLFKLFFNIQQQRLSEKSNARTWPRLSNNAAVWIAEHFAENGPDSFFMHQIDFYERLAPEMVQTKLWLDFCSDSAFRYLRDEPGLALGLIGEGLPLARKLRDKKRYLDLLTRIQYLLNEYYGLTNTALALGKHIISESDKMGYVLKSALSRFYNASALIDQGYYTQARDELLKALETVNAYNHRVQVMNINERLAVAYRHLGEFDMATDALEKANQIAVPDDNHYARNRYFISKALLYRDLGKFAAADSCFMRGYDLADQKNDKANRLVALEGLGKLYNEMGDYDSALAYFEQALKSLTHETPFISAAILIGITETYAAIGKMDKATESAKRASGYLAQHNFGMLRARSYLAVGMLQNKIADFEGARNSFRQSVAGFDKIEDIAKKIGALNLLGETYRQMASLDSAEIVLGQAAALCGKYPRLALAWSTNYYLARLQADLGKENKAQDYLLKSIRDLENLTADITSTEQQTAFAQKIYPVFEEMVLLKMKRGAQLEAFLYAERMRANVLRTLLQDPRSQRGTEPATYSKAGFTPGFSATEASIDMASLQAQLDEASYVLEYEVTDSCTIVWVVGRHDFSAEVLNVSRTEIEELLIDYRAHMQIDSVVSLQALNRGYGAVRTLGKQLYERLYAPATRHLKTVKNLYIVPDETLNYLPFSALVLPDGRFLIEQCAIARAPSASILQLALAENGQPEKTDMPLLAVAVDELPDSIVEAKTVAALLPGSVLLSGQQVTKDSLRALLRKPCPALLFSTHGRIDERRPANSALVMAFGKHLRLDEILRLRLTANQLVYLAACESASGRLYRGEGLISLQRAFRIAGARSVVANLWEIDDDTTKELTVAFFRNWLINKKSKAEALRHAKLEMIQKLAGDSLVQAHPYFWAAATLTGSPK